MTEEILINVRPREVRAAVVDDGVLRDLLIERASRRGLVGNIFKGQVSRVLPGMQAAFVDIGLERTAFLHASDIALPQNAATDTQDRPQPNVRELVSEGAEILVQILKEPIGNKGARLTTFITIPSRYLVLMPVGTGLGISARIEDAAERVRLKEVMESLLAADSDHGYIIRTAAEGAGLDALRTDKLYVDRLWETVNRDAAESPCGRVVHEDLPLPVRVIRDLSNRDIERVLVDSEEWLQKLKDFAESFAPDLVSILELYTGRGPLLDLYGVEDEIERALARKVELKSGGYVVIDQTEAMTTVDVNTGGYVGRGNLEETIFRTNLEAAVAIARQLRLRNLGGLVIIDFIDMEVGAHRERVLSALETALASDHAKTQIAQVSPLGLVEMTRKRTQESLEHVMCQPCPTCHARGYIKTPESICYEIFREILRQHRQCEFSELMVLAHEDVIEMLLDEESSTLAELEELVGKPISLQSQALNAQDQFDVVPM
jgi:ribonuclease G